ncbi:MAG: DUF3243 family protein [Syntrophomonadaceae bacterium]|nr:DUF3243 family protein [Syntrophomonadaceae bacterium]
MAELASLFPRELAENIRDGLKHGVSDEQMIKGMVSMGNLMSRLVRPDSPEEALMAEMWKAATDEEKRMMAEIILRLGKKHLH